MNRVNLVPAWTGPNTGLLIDARDYYREFYRVAKEAQHSIAVAGWQFDRDVCLLRGEEATLVEEDVQFLPFLDRLCRERPQLQVYLLAWDFSVLYAIEREWMQRLFFNLTTPDRLKFRFAAHPSIAGSHHQKLAVIDGAVAFTGGMDLCTSRWDDRSHLVHNPYRSEGNKTHGPYHDVQAFVTGPAAARVASLFQDRWEDAGHGKIDLGVASTVLPQVRASLPLPPGPVSFSRTRCKTETLAGLREIRALYLTAIDAAEELIYIENQYFTSQAIFEALVKRLEAKERTPLQVVFVLPQKPQAMKEQVALGIEHSRMLDTLTRTAAAHGHSLGLYYSSGTDLHGTEIPTYIHAKLMIVDDVFLTVGSANTTNRSMGLDSELNTSWEDRSLLPGGLKKAIRQARVNLLREHCGIADGEADVETVAGLVERLGTLAQLPGSKLRAHRFRVTADDFPLVKAIAEDGLKLDPEDAEEVFEVFGNDPEGTFARGIQGLVVRLRQGTTAP